MRHLVIHDVDAIQRYVFATSKLREIRGASALIDTLNRDDTPRLVKQYGGMLIYAAGGGAAADFTNRGMAEVFCRNVASLYVSRTSDASSTGVVVDFEENAPGGDSNSFQSALRRAHCLLGQEKTSRVRKTQLLTNPYFKRCEACGVYPGTQYDSPPPGAMGEMGRFICDGCYAKCQEGEGQPTIHRDVRRQAGRPISFARELDEIGGSDARSSYIGVIYADGNRMGERFQQVRNRDGLRDFSRVIDTATRDAISAVLLGYYPTSEYLPVIVPLCGGDDLVVITPGRDALKIALDYLEVFQKRVKQTLPHQVAEMLSSREVSGCAGIAIAKSHTPLSALFDLAHELCGLAKQRSYELFRTGDPIGQEVPCVDFQVVTTPGWGDVEVVRRAEYRLGDQVRLTARPFTLSGARGLLDAVKVLKREKLPSGKLHDIYRSLRQGRYQATFHYLTLCSRARETSAGPKQQTALREAARHLRLGYDYPPWQPWDGRPADFLQTPYGDLVEIYEFVPE